MQNCPGRFSRCTAERALLLPDVKASIKIITTVFIWEEKKKQQTKISLKQNRNCRNRYTYIGIQYKMNMGFQISGERIGCPINDVSKTDYTFKTNIKSLPLTTQNKKIQNKIKI